MIDLLNSAAVRYPGPVAHDATGGGSVVAEYVTAREVIDFQMNLAVSGAVASQFVGDQLPGRAGTPCFETSHPSRSFLDALRTQ